MIKDMTKNKQIDYISKKRKCDICSYKYSIVDKDSQPVMLTCCNYILCYKCLRTYISTNDTVICLYCRYDHVVDDDYLIQYEMSDTVDMEKWIPWWENHMDIFL